MKVYAEYFELDGLQYRLNTLLQFGSSWELIGNAVLANPGSASPAVTAPSEILEMIGDFFTRYRPEEKIKHDNWHIFSPDPTMGFVEKIFGGSYIGQQKELNGVIQLFNTFNIRNANLEQAIAQSGKSSRHMLSSEAYKYFNDKPTYFGFGSQVLGDKKLQIVAMDIFNGASDTVKSLYDQDFHKNSFYHPMYVNRAYKQPNFQKYRSEVLAKLA